ncbi:carboxymuconolactone decarboxylase family protein [Fervidicoccus fontis]|uniref:Carboxymuconolactone decarboxylase family protein n=1 Tax=Fervidicoccus fontis TaxID=683846 RepID=A0A2J6N7M2_9CREN|nr:carboxymuconolactone decarboxylase family protein [Fervidicoccus fontis]PMB75467.1 MAG: carboxymuconolactone decarboxylase family protein [Fervidicoccus fontis]PMB77332.1 MAG: carboxymuconolactone decarboxylase family protein [Fervidicoccus fontis]PMB78610.1 MAG: carboxymuconolactone decarboxylase family protein [Fervidicoccus fontis]HEW63767.1 carboxymuconolactone decarboxylase family protein [Fervidicoccus fontis]
MEKLKEFNNMMNVLGKISPEKANAFVDFVNKVEKNGALDAKTKELIALSIGIVKNCETCIYYHLNEAMKLGASREEILEAAWVAVLMDGGPSLAHLEYVIKALYAPLIKAINEPYSKQ